MGKRGVTGNDGILVQMARCAASMVTELDYVTNLSNIAPLGRENRCLNQ